MFQPVGKAAQAAAQHQPHLGRGGQPVPQIAGSQSNLFDHRKNLLS